MTVIAWDGITLAADKRACLGAMVGTVTKIRRIGDLIVGGAGEPAFIGAMMAWIEGGRDQETFPKQQQDKDDWSPILVIEPDGTPSIYERTAFPVRNEQKHIAIGSGREFARAAMYLGCDARKAVEVAIALDCGCGNGIDTLTMAPDGQP